MKNNVQNSKKDTPFLKKRRSLGSFAGFARLAAQLPSLRLSAQAPGAQTA